MYVRTNVSLSRSLGMNLLQAAVVLLLFSVTASFASATTISRDDLPRIKQLDPAYGDGGKMWCAPVATTACFEWLAHHYKREWLLEYGGEAWDTERRVKYLARVMGTNDQTGTTEVGILNGIRTYLDWFTRPYDWTSLWKIEVYADPNMRIRDGPGLTAHAPMGFQDLWGEFAAGEDVLLAHSRPETGKHLVVLQKLSNEKNTLGLYPGAIMNPWTGQYEDVGFSVDADGRLWLFDDIGRHVYFAVTVSPIPEPATVLCVSLAMSGVSAYVRRRRAAGPEPGCPYAFD